MSHVHDVVDGPHAATMLRTELERHRADLAERLAGGEDGTALGRANALFLEKWMQSRFEAASRDARNAAAGIALAAAGSFGRGAVALRSDADVALIVNPRVVSAKDAGSFAEALLYPLWDATLTVGHQVLIASEAIALAKKDLATSTALLDLRFLAGNQAVFEDLAARAREALFGEEDLGTFVDRLEAEASARHQRFGGSVYLLEPDVKSGEGGLRDLDGARWAARARYRVGDPDVNAVTGGSASPWDELVRLGVLVTTEARDIAAAEEFLWRVRNRLHARAGRKSDRLGFEEQEALAVAMGYGADRARSAERLMQEYYLRARAVTRAREALFERLRPRRRRRKAADVDLGGGVRLFDGSVTIAASSELQQTPEIALRVYEACVRQKAPILPFARDAIARAASDPVWCERLRRSAEASSAFVDLVCTVAVTRARRGSVVGDMHDVGVLLAMVPEFLPVTGRVHHDVYHVYTVDVHSVAAVDRLREFARGELAHEFPLASRLAVEIASPRPLFLATLLHDVGKGWPDEDGSRKDHSKTGANMCTAILERLGFTAEEIDEARQLVLQHLLMYRVATRRDLDDPATIEEFCKDVRGSEGLRNLYLLTVSDLSTTSPTAMTSWKARMLDELYLAAATHFAGRQSSGDVEPVERMRKALLSAWKGPSEVLFGVIDSMPQRYLLTNTPESIVEHVKIVTERADRPAHVGVVASRHREAVELCVVADDRPGLLAAIAAAITANRLEVLAAQVYSRPSGAGSEAVDLFWVRDRDGGVEGVATALPRLARDLEEVCSGRVQASELLRLRMGSGSPWRERPSPAVATEVIVDDRASPRHTVVEVFAKDRPGLLYTLAHAFHDLGLSIAISKINTEGTRAADVFYVSEFDGAKVSAGPRYQEIREGLLRAVEG